MSSGLNLNCSRRVVGEEEEEEKKEWKEVCESIHFFLRLREAKWMMNEMKLLELEWREIEPMSLIT